MIDLDRQRLESCPEGYRHLAYLQLGLGFTVAADLPGLDGPARLALRSRAAGWLAGQG